MRSRLIAFAIAAGVLVLDQVTKMVIRGRVSTYDTYTVIPGFFNIIHTENPGAAFSLFAGSQSELRAFFLVGVSVAALILIGFLLWRPGGRAEENRWMRLGLALVMGGALGNLWDRVVRGAVTDFLEFYLGSYHWPAFNVADTAITTGVGLVLLVILGSRRAGAKS